ncbi:MAG: hypothetical protein ACUZ8O_01940 [Candidatus Anammoxibacter sp.]
MYILLSCQKIRDRTIPRHQVSGIKYLCCGLLALCLTFSTSLYFAAYADLLYLKGSDYGINVEINKSDAHSVTATIPKGNIVDIMVNTSNDTLYPDSLKLKYNVKELHCKVLETRKTVIITRIPMIEVASFNISLSDPGIQNSIENLQNEENKQPISKYSGMVKGAILSKGSLLTKCQVRIYRLEPKGFLFFKRYKQGDHYETMTDNNGNYMFKNIPEGSYKLFWKRNLGEPWMKRIETEPDIFVLGGKQTIAAPFDIDPG